MSYLQEAKKNLNERKRRREEDCFLALEELRKNDDFSIAESNLLSLRFELAKRKANQADFGNLECEIKDAEIKFSQLLKQYGKTERDLRCEPLCPICGDRYTVDGKPCVCVISEMKRLERVSENRPTETGTEFPVSFPECSEQEEAHNLRATELVKRWTDGFPNLTKTTLILTGKTGVGKSKLASVAANILNERDFSALFLNAQRLNDLFLRSYLAPLWEKESILLAVYDADLLVVDDLGAESFLQKVTAEYLYTLLSVRSGRPLVITTNLTPNELRERYGERVFSRLFDKSSSLTVELVGKDLRLSLKR